MMIDLVLVENSDPLKIEWFRPHQIPEFAHEGNDIKSITFSETVLIRMWDEDTDTVGYFTGWYRYDLRAWVIHSISTKKRNYTIDVDRYLSERFKLKGDLFKWIFMPEDLETGANPDGYHLIHLN